MTRITTAGDRLLRAGGLVDVLDAAYEAFEVMLSVIRAGEDPADALFVPLVMAGAPAADGRDTIAFAPSLPPRTSFTPQPLQNQPARRSRSAGYWPQADHRRPGHPDPGIDHAGRRGGGGPLGVRRRVH